MAAEPVQELPNGPGWLYELKLDGYRVQLRVESSQATLKTRKGLDWTAKFPEISRDAAKLPDCIVDGEVCALNERGVPDFAALQAALADDDSKALVFFAFDMLFAEHEDLRRLPLVAVSRRLGRLEKFCVRGTPLLVENLSLAGAVPASERPLLCGALTL